MTDKGMLGLLGLGGFTAQIYYELCFFKEYANNGPYTYNESWVYYRSTFSLLSLVTHLEMAWRMVSMIHWPLHLCMLSSSSLFFSFFTSVQHEKMTKLPHLWCWVSQLSTIAAKTMFWYIWHTHILNATTISNKNHCLIYTVGHHDKVCYVKTSSCILASIT